MLLKRLISLTLLKEEGIIPVLFKIMRSDVEWFPIFIDKCKRSLSYLDEQCMDHEAGNQLNAGVFSQSASSVMTS